MSVGHISHLSKHLVILMMGFLIISAVVSNDAVAAKKKTSDCSVKKKYTHTHKHSHTYTHRHKHAHTYKPKAHYKQYTTSCCTSSCGVETCSPCTAEYYCVTEFSYHTRWNSSSVEVCYSASCPQSCGC